MVVIRFALALIVLILGGFTLLGLVLAVLKRLGSWNKTYEALGKRYAAKVKQGFFFAKPSMMFDYGRTTCVLKNRRPSRRSGQQRTQLVMNWRDRALQLVVSTEGEPAATWHNRRLMRVELDSADNGSPIFVSSNQPLLAKRLLTPGARWQIRQLQNLSLNSGVRISIDRGKLVIAKPGYIKDYLQLDDFVRFGLELFDQFMLTLSKGIEFVDSESAQIVGDVKCPICSEPIVRDMVVCVRCKTPHCADCWEYNGQCATFACRETRYLRTGMGVETKRSSA